MMSLTTLNENDDHNNNGLYLIENSPITSSPQLTSSITPSPPPQLTSNITTSPSPQLTSNITPSPHSPSLSYLNREFSPNLLLAKRQFSAPAAYASAVPGSISSSSSSSYSAASLLSSSSSPYAASSSSKTDSIRRLLSQNPNFRLSRSFSDPSVDPAIGSSLGPLLSDPAIQPKLPFPVNSPLPVNSPKKLQCDQCEKTFASVSGWKKHVESKHFGIRYPCKICNKGFIGQKEVEIHIDSVHYNKREYACHLCDKRYNEDKVLRKHILWVHYKVRDFRCRKCGKEFGQLVHLRRHFDSVHLGKVYTCHICCRKFTRDYRLKQHYIQDHGASSTLAHQFIVERRKAATTSPTASTADARRGVDEEDDGSDGVVGGDGVADVEGVAGGNRITDVAGAGDFDKADNAIGEEDKDAASTKNGLAVSNGDLRSAAEDGLVFSNGQVRAVAANGLLNAEGSMVGSIKNGNGSMDETVKNGDGTMVGSMKNGNGSMVRTMKSAEGDRGRWKSSLISAFDVETGERWTLDGACSLKKRRGDGRSGRGRWGSKIKGVSGMDLISGQADLSDAMMFPRLNRLFSPLPPSPSAVGSPLPPQSPFAGFLPFSSFSTRTSPPPPPSSTLSPIDLRIPNAENQKLFTENALISTPPLPPLVKISSLKKLTSTTSLSSSSLLSSSSMNSIPISLISSLSSPSSMTRIISMTPQKIEAFSTASLVTSKLFSSSNGIHDAVSMSSLVNDALSSLPSCVNDTGLLPSPENDRLSSLPSAKNDVLSSLPSPVNAALSSLPSPENDALSSLPSRDKNSSSESVPFTLAEKAGTASSSPPLGMLEVEAAETILSLCQARLNSH